MLIEIRCSLFRQNPIIFHPGLNVILGDPSAKNSIGKSTALLLIDFVFGSSSFLDHDGGAIKALGQHTYYFKFSFSEENFYFSRSTSDSTIVNICNSEYQSQSTIPLEDYNNFLKDKYGLLESETSFRNLVGTYSRIWGKKNDDVEKPLNSVPKQPDVTAINTLIDLFGRWNEVATADADAKKKAELLTTLKKAFRLALVPGITTKQFKTNTETINEAQNTLEAIKKGFSDTLTKYYNLFNGEILELQNAKDDLLEKRRYYQEKQTRLKRDLSASNHNVSANMRQLIKFFPGADLQKISEIESFHNKLGKILSVDLRKNLKDINEQLQLLDKDLAKIDQTINNLLQQQGTPQDIFEKAISVSKTLEVAYTENSYYAKEKELAADNKLAKQNIQAIKNLISIEICTHLNTKMRELTTQLLSANRQSPAISIIDETYKFIPFSDTGTGKSYLNLICIDLAILSTTKLPFLIHDSILFKNVENEAISPLINIYASHSKQIFISIDEAQKYGDDTANTLKRHAAIELNSNKLLYTKDWRSSVSDKSSPT